MRSVLGFFVFSIFGMGAVLPGHSAGPQPPEIVVSIQPLHSLVAGVMHGVSEPYLLLKGRQSPHHFQLKPSDARRISNADLVIWVGPLLESPLQKILTGLGRKAASMPVMQIKGLNVLDVRSPHSHDDHGDEAHASHSHSEDHEEHDESTHKDKDHDDEAHAGHEHEENKGHDEHAHNQHDDAGKDETEHSAHNGKDPHIWLDIENAILITKTVSERLGMKFPRFASQFKANAKEQVKQLKQLKSVIETQLSPLQNRPYMVFHDAYHYFSHDLKLNFQGAITLRPGHPPSAKHLHELRQTLAKKGIVCVFTEPQFSSKIVTTLIGERAIKTGMIDPIGVDIPPGRGAYVQMMQKLSTEFGNCLRPAS